MLLKVEESDHHLAALSSSRSTNGKANDDITTAIMSAVTRSLELGIVSEEDEGSAEVPFTWEVWRAALVPILVNNDVPVQYKGAPAIANISVAGGEGEEDQRRRLEQLKPTKPNSSPLSDPASNPATPLPPLPEAMVVMVKCEEIETWRRSHRATQNYFRFVVSQACLTCEAHCKQADRVQMAAQR